MDQPTTADRPLWKLDGVIARTTVGNWALSVDLLDPGAGVHIRPFSRGRELGDGFLGIVLPEFTAGDREALTDVWVRGTDLVATYRATEQRPVRVQVYWRCPPVAPCEIADAAPPPVVLDLIIAVQTDLLDAASRLTVQSRLPKGPLEWRKFQGIADETVRWEPASGPGPGHALLVRPLRRTVSWLEAMHPAEYAADQMAESEAGRTLTHQLFGEGLEKGVILQARLRGALLARSHDHDQAATVIRAFLQVPPPLST